MRNHRAKQPLILGLTGGIGTGKSMIAHFLRQQGAAVHDADAVVKTLLQQPSIIASVVSIFGDDVVSNQQLNRAKIAALAFAQPHRLKKLQRLLHPLVRAAERQTITRARQQGKRLVVLEIPLLFETGAATRCDAIWLAQCSLRLQRLRVLARPHYSPQRLAATLRQQWPAARRLLVLRRQGGKIIRTDKNISHLRAQLRRLTRALRCGSV